MARGPALGIVVADGDRIALDRGEHLGIVAVCDLDAALCGDSLASSLVLLASGDDLERVHLCRATIQVSDVTVPESGKGESYGHGYLALYVCCAN
jgi:hypothetical protein